MGALTDALLNALGFAGNVVDTPGSVARGLLAGEPGRAFGGILDPSQRVSGREMLEGYGALGPNQEGLDLGDILGFGAEMVTDPTNLLIPGAARATSAAARRARGFNQAQAAIEAAGGMPRALAQRTALGDKFGPKIYYMPEIGPEGANVFYPRPLFLDPAGASEMALANANLAADPVDAAAQIQARVRPVYAYAEELMPQVDDMSAAQHARMVQQIGSRPGMEGFPRFASVHAEDDAGRQLLALKEMVDRYRFGRDVPPIETSGRLPWNATQGQLGQRMYEDLMESGVQGLTRPDQFEYGGRWMSSPAEARLAAKVGYPMVPRVPYPAAQILEDANIFSPMIYDAPMRVPTQLPLAGAVIGANVLRGMRER